MTAPRPLRASRVREILGVQRFTRDLRILGAAGSTSDLVLQQAGAGAGDGLVIAAELQRAGRGRRGSSWCCPAGAGLLFSVLLRPPPPADLRLLLSPACAMAVARALEPLGLAARLKWPNDVLVSDCKLAGILIDLEADAAVVGIGVNVNQDTAGLPVEAPLKAASLALLLGASVDREALLAAILRHLGTVLEELDSGGEAQLVSEWHERDALTGRRVTVREGDRVVTGTVLETHLRQGLGMRLEDGSDVRLRPEHSHVLAIEPS